jgi:hypothetical protein
VQPGSVPHSRGPDARQDPGLRLLGEDDGCLSTRVVLHVDAHVLDRDAIALDLEAAWVIRRRLGLDQQVLHLDVRPSRGMTKAAAGTSLA